MDEKQIKGIANSRAYDTLKPYRYLIVSSYVALYLVTVIYMNVVPFIVMGAILIAGYLYIYQKTNKIQYTIIQNKSWQQLSDEDLKGLAGDNVAKTILYKSYIAIVCIICVIPILPLTFDMPIPLYHRLPLAIFGVMCGAAFILWNKRQIKHLKEQVKKEFN